MMKDLSKVDFESTLRPSDLDLRAPRLPLRASIWLRGIHHRADLPPRALPLLHKLHPGISLLSFATRPTHHSLRDRTRHQLKLRQPLSLKLLQPQQLSKRETLHYAHSTFEVSSPPPSLSIRLIAWLTSPVYYRCTAVPRSSQTAIRKRVRG